MESTYTELALYGRKMSVLGLVPYASVYLMEAARHAPLGMRRNAITKALDKLLDTRISSVPPCPGHRLLLV